MDRNDIRDMIKRKYGSFEKSEEYIHISVKRLRNCLNGNVTPSVQEMEVLSRVLDIEMHEIIEVFNPTDIKKVFFSAQSFKAFVSFSLRFRRGTISCDDCIYQIDKMITHTNTDSIKEDTTILFYDINHNYILLSSDLVGDVIPVKADYNVFSFKIDVFYPVFPTEETFVPGKFKQTILVSFMV